MLEKIIKILSEYTRCTDITEKSTLIGDLGLSSFEIVDLVTAFEEAFGVEISDRDIPKFVTVQDIWAYIQEKQSRA